MPQIEFVTVGRRTNDGWACVNDAGQPRALPAAALAGLRNVRAGQRLRAEVTDGIITRAELPVAG